MTTAAVSGASWLLSLHVLAAFAVAAPVAALLITAVALRSGSPSRAPAFRGLVRASGIVFRAGVVATLVFGIWLVLTRAAYSVLDAWVIAALVLWLAIGGLGDAAISRLRKATNEVQGPAAADGTGTDVAAPEAGPAASLRRAVWLEAGAAVAVLAELAVMLWRPGA
jgi:hypothetical protein